MSAPALSEAIESYHDLLTDDLAEESQARLDDQQRRRGLYFGARPLCSVLRPRFLTSEQYRFLSRHIRILMRVFDKAFRAAIEDPALRAQFGLSDWEEALIAHDPGFRAPSPTSRLDAFFVGEQSSLRFTEYNAEVPAAPAYNDVLSDAFFGLPVMRAFQRQYQVHPLPARHGVLNALLEAHRQWAGRREAPRIAILDWREVPTYSEFVLFADYFRTQGFECVIADPRELEYRGGRLVVAGFHVTLLYKRVLISELVEREGLASPVLRAVRDGAVCMVNPFRCKLLHKKASLAVLSDERNARLFSDDECGVIAAHVPWTRRVEDRQTQYRGRTVDLLPLIHHERERFVLKANDEYGGKGIFLGWETAPDEWARTIRRALDEPFVVQERVALSSEPYAGMIDGRVQMIDRLLDTAPFIVDGDYVAGCLTRLSTEALLNVTAGGGSTVPTLLVEKR